MKALSILVLAITMVACSSPSARRAEQKSEFNVNADTAITVLFTSGDTILFYDDKFNGTMGDAIRMAKPIRAKELKVTRVITTKIQF